MAYFIVAREPVLFFLSPHIVGLSPRAALVVQKKDQQGVVTQGQGPGRFFRQGRAGEGREGKGGEC